MSKRNTKFTATDIDGTFEAVTDAKVGTLYHLSWAFKAAVFRLVSIEEDGIYGQVDNPKYKRTSPLKIKLSDLRKTR